MPAWIIILSYAIAAVAREFWEWMKDRDAERRYIRRVGRALDHVDRIRGKLR